MRVRIDSLVSFDTPGLESYTHISTAYEANVVEVLKAHPRLVGAGASQPLSGPGGSIQRADGSTDTTVGNLMVRLPIGTEWVLFLCWSGQHLQPIELTQRGIHLFR